MNWTANVTVGEVEEIEYVFNGKVHEKFRYLKYEMLLSDRP